MKTQLRPSSPTPADRLRDVVQYSEMKRMADNILGIQRHASFRTLAVLSLFGQEGKTLFSAMMAMAYTEATHARALVVDTTTLHNPPSLNLRQCLDPNDPMIDFLSVEDFRKTPNGHAFIREHRSEDALRPEVMQTSSLSVKRESDQFLIRKLADERNGDYGLILLDTAPLAIRNKSNIDPMLVARVADASVLVMNSHQAHAPNMEAHLRMLMDPALHLIGIVSNEEFYL